MKKKITMMLLLLLSLKYSAQSQQLITENFDYIAATPLTVNGWVQTAVATPLLNVASTGLTYTGYNQSAIGNAAKLDTTGQDVYRDLYGSVTTGSIYTAMMINISKATTAGDYFFSYLAPNSTNNYTARLSAKLVSTGYYKVGISKGTETVIYSADSFALNTTSLLVIKYQYITGNVNDSISVFNFTSGFPTTEPSIAAVVTTGGITSADATALGRIALRQGGAANAARLTVDGIRTATTWSELNTATTALISPSAFNITFTTTTTTSTRIAWAKNTNYSDNNYTTLVFLKAVSPITIGSANLSANSYTADTNFISSSSVYQNDANAKCMFKGDTNYVNVAGLNQNTLYQVAILVVKNTDSVYSLPTAATVTTLSTAPRAITGLSFVATGPTTAKISWTKPVGYVSANYTMVVYVKQSSSITPGIPNTNPIAITADSNFSGSGSTLALDLNARCTYKGDTTFVNVTGLNAGTNYFVSAYAINDVDSNYSPVINTSGITVSNGPVNVKLVSFVSFTSTSTRISWTKDTSYKNANFTTLVFLKQGAVVTQGTPNLDPTGITANSVFGSGSKYQNDTAAFCVFKGDTNFLTVSNLTPSTVYYALVYVINDSDSLYSNPSTGAGITKAAPPLNVSAATFTGLTTNTAVIAWTKPVGYTNATSTTLVFVKAGSAITEGTPTRTVTSMVASTFFNSTTSTRYQNDTFGRCVYKGDSSFVNILAINNYTDYHVLIYVVRDNDSTYSLTSTTTSGTASPTPPPPSSYTISQIGNINSTTGVPDSLNVRVALRGKVYGVNQRPIVIGGMQFVLRDNTGGITISNPSTDLGYTVTVGDSIMVFGVVSSNRGLLTLITLDSLSVLATGKTIAAPKLVTSLNETTENDLVRLNVVKFVNKPIGNWASGQTYSIITANNDTAAIRIYATSTLIGTPFPTTTYFHVTGFGSQVSNNTAPYAFTGYQILPRTVSDVISYNAVGDFHVVTPVTNNNVTILGDSNQTMPIIWTKAILDPISSSVGPVIYTLLIDTLGGNFRNPIATLPSKNAGLDTSLALTFGQLRTLLVSLGVQTNQTLSLKWKVNASAGVFTKSSDTLLTNFILSYGMGVQNQMAKNIVVYPNPCTENIFVQLPAQLSNNATVEIIDLTGKIIITKNIDNKSLNEVSINTNLLAKGIYLLKLTNESETFIQKIIKE